MSSIDRRASRLASASPLVGRGPERYSTLELPPAADDDELLGAPAPASDVVYQGFDDEYDSFQMHEPAADVRTQTVAQTQWMEATLDREARNFLGFVKAEVDAAVEEEEAQRARRAANDNDEEDDHADELALPPPPLRPAEQTARPTVLFENLLPPEEHSTIVAAQALHHVLALATKKLLHVRQDEPFGGIRLGLVG